ncbi:FAD-binding oxidoreductase [Rhizobiales bacterium L72]|uniref:FAD-binding oxidoreductase n=2 Tax=Propylenella binzhouense TaxID=2555902 RepID=A0A964T3M3_9HYPH|nr:FAD-binding oxidoreductase [Propylenella binzhouense]
MNTEKPGRDHGEAVRALAERLAGSAHLPGAPAYGEACRIWNAMIERRPALVVRPRDDGEIAEAIAFARRTGLPLSVRGGGHNVAGAALCDGGVTIDMSTRRAVAVDPAAMEVRVEAGATWKDVDTATQQYGLVVPSGIISATGVAGLTLGAGFGWTSRRFGFTADNLVTADVVTADGRSVRASAEEHSDLFWALRGGGGNFGVVTSFTFRAHRHGPQALCGMVVHPFERADAVMRLYRAITAEAPDELTCLLILRKAPPAPFIPAELHGKPIAAIAAHWTGDPAEGAAAMARLKAFGPPAADTIAPKDFVAFQSFLDGGQPFGRRYYWKSNEAGAMADGLMAVLRESAAANPSPHSAILVMHLGGAPARTAPDTNAVGIRAAQYGVVVQGAWEEGAEDDLHIGWVRRAFEATKPFGSGAAYVNFLTEEEAPGRIRAAYGEALYRRLRAIKTAYDPENLFRGNLNIPPLAPGE